MDFNGVPFNFKFYPDTYNSIYSRESKDSDHKFIVEGLDLVTLVKVGTMLDFSEAIDQFNKDVAEYKVKSKEYEANKLKLKLENCQINKDRAELVLAGFTVPTVELCLEKQSTMEAIKRVVNPHDSTDYVNLTISNCDGAYNIYLSWELKSTGRVKSLKTALLKAAEFEKEWIDKKNAEKGRVDYKETLQNHMKCTFGITELKSQEEFYRDHRGAYVVTGHKYLVEESKDYNGEIYLKPSMDALGKYTYHLTTGIKFNEVEALEIVKYLRNVLAKRDEKSKPKAAVA